MSKRCVTRRITLILRKKAQCSYYVPRRHRFCSNFYRQYFFKASYNLLKATWSNMVSDTLDYVIRLIFPWICPEKFKNMFPLPFKKENLQSCFCLPKIRNQSNTYTPTHTPTPPHTRAFKKCFSLLCIPNIKFSFHQIRVMYYSYRKKHHRI